ncbi:TOX high mobility group box family member 3, partial [Aplysia californica]|uniref:TOX high mobility group box family member 3 n=1 Tax=Aplysia californica TaxID=6500 RepID=A0ABM1A6L4_APLCA
MAEQTNPSTTTGSGSAPPQSPSQSAQTFSLSPHSLSGMDVPSMGQMGQMGLPTTMGQGMHPLPAAGDPLAGLAPKFPPQNFDVPDINFSNSVSPNFDFDQSLFTTAQMLSQSNALFATSSGHGMEGQPIAAGHGGMGVAMQTTASNQMGRTAQQMPMGFFPGTSNSPPGTSSSEDSDDLPLAQLAKRAGSAGSTPPGPHTTVASPPTTTVTSAGADTVGGGSKEGSPAPGATKKAKPSKRKKKKDPNEPQKPVSAYALFFRDTQATIKGHNPNASFGEVSKIVASMWDQLDPEHKDVYKKKTEMAKKQ